MISSTLQAAATEFASQPTWAQWADLIGALFILVGAAFTFISALGLFRFSSLYARMHAATKPQMLGLLFLCTGIVLTLRTWQWALVAVLVVGIQMVAAPVASHIMSRAAYRTRAGNLEDLMLDELGEDAPNRYGVQTDR